MFESIICRVKFTLWLALFIAPVLVAVWHQQLDRTIAENAYLPALEPTQFVAAAE